MKRCSTFYGPPLVGVSSLSTACFGSCWLPFSFVLSVFSWQISSIICYCECYSDCNISMKVLALSVRTLGYSCGSAPILLTPSVWLNCCWWSVVGLDSACEGTALMFCVVQDLCSILFVRASIPTYFPSPQRSRQFKCGGPFLQCWARLSPTVIGPSVLSKGVKTGPTTTHFGPACAQTMPRLPRIAFICPW